CHRFLPGGRLIRNSFCFGIVQPLCLLVHPVLVKGELYRPSLRVNVEGDLSINLLQEKLPLALGEYSGFPLATDLHEKLVAFPRDSEGASRTLVAADVGVED